MAAPTKYATPLEQLMELARDACCGRGPDGSPRTPFEEFWQRAVRPGQTIIMVTTPNPPAGAILWPTDRNDRVTWQGAIEDAMEGIQRAYECTPASSHEAALKLLAPVFEGVREAVEEAEEEQLDELTDLMAAA